MTLIPLDSCPATAYRHHTSQTPHDVAAACDDVRLSLSKDRWGWVIGLRRWWAKNSASSTLPQGDIMNACRYGLTGLWGREMVICLTDHAVVLTSDLP